MSQADPYEEALQEVNDLREDLEAALRAGAALVGENAGRQGFVSSNWEDRAEFCRLAGIRDPEEPSSNEGRGA